MWLFPLTASFISALVSGIVLRLYLDERQPQHLAWTAALLLMALATSSEFIGAVSGWTPLIMRTYYLSGAVVPVGFLALGTIYSMAPRTLARAWLGLMLVLFIAAFLLTNSAGVDRQLLQPGVEPAWQALRKPEMLTVLAWLINTAGTVVVLGGAARSALAGRRRKANFVIAAGILAAAGGGFLPAPGGIAVQSIGQSVGVALVSTGIVMTALPQGRSALRFRDAQAS